MQGGSLPRGRTRCLHLGRRPKGQRDSKRTRESFALRSARKRAARKAFFYRDWIRYFRQHTAGCATPVVREILREIDILYRNKAMPQAHDAPPRLFIRAKSGRFSLFLPLSLSELTLRRCVFFNLTRWIFPIRDTPDGLSL